MLSDETRALLSEIAALTKSDQILDAAAALAQRWAPPTPLRVAKDDPSTMTADEMLAELTERLDRREAKRRGLPPGHTAVILPFRPRS